MSNFTSLIQWAIYFLRWAGPLVIIVITMVVFISAAAQSRLSPGRMIAVGASGLLGAALFWLIPTVISDVGGTVNSVAPYVPSGGYGGR
ncbi:MAG: hypothetical protein JWN03_8460 [Nocardia sp.]|uniref:hypothetical protein n=1 Tax=Nocardia sp. TaxID=1821 RepID=UPI00261AA460|nr:hypothetical protein [Nocardia sp.]MCU1648185.1 hypothetical protein [Nocardia sp.]